jgi:CHAT domain-containing protein/Tfp pilus assembly protein PilF
MKHIEKLKNSIVVFILFALTFTAFGQTPKPDVEKQKQVEAIIAEAFSLFQQGTAESYNKALTKFKEARVSFQALGDKKNEAICLLISGRIYNDLGDKQTALLYYEPAIPLFKQVDDSGGLAATFSNIGVIYEFLGNKQKALEYFNQAVPLWIKLNNDTGLSQTLNNIGTVHNSLGNKEKALEYYNQALSLYVKLKDFVGQSQALNNIGATHYSLGDKQKALEFYFKAQDLYHNPENRITDISIQATALNNIGEVYDSIGEREKALEYLNQALSLRRKTPDVLGLAATLNNIGITYYLLGNSPKALEALNEVLPLFIQVGNKVGQTTALNNIGAIYIRLGEHRKGLENLNKALLLYEETKNEGVKATTHNNIGDAYRELGNWKEAIFHLSQALEIFKKTGDKEGMAIALGNIGLVYDFSGNKNKALEYYYRSLPLARQSVDKRGEAGTLSNMMIFWSEKDRQKAIFYGKQSVNIYQQLRANIKGLDKATRQTYLNTIDDKYRNLADILIAEGRIAEAEQVLEMLKDEEYFSYLRRNDQVAADLKSRLSLTPEEKKAFEEYEKNAEEITRTAEAFGVLDKKKNSLPLGESLSADEQKQFNKLKTKYDAAVTVFNKFLEDLKVKFSQVDVRVKVVESDTIGLLKKLNQPRTVIISTIVGEDRLNLIVTTSGIQKAHTVNVKAVDLNKLIAGFRDAVKDPNIDPRPLGKKLYDKLFPKELQKDLENINADTIVWSLDGILRYVPPAALWDGERYLTERYSNAVITLASRNKLDAKTNADRQNWLVFGVGVSKKFENFNELPAVPKELCSIVKDVNKTDFCKSYGEKGVFTGLILTDQDFTIDGFQNNLGKTSIVHIASHFALNSGDYKDSYLLLGGGTNRRFSLENLQKTRLDNIELLTLSACNTAISSGNNSNGIEVEGFGALAQNQGVKSVLATLWAVADASTGIQMTEFYKILERNPTIGKAEALHQAQLKMMQGEYKTLDEAIKNRSDKIILGGENSDQPEFKKDSKTPFAHPYYWSPFVLIGNWK